MSGQISIDLSTGLVKKGSVAEQTQIILENIKTILEEAGTNLNNVLKCNVYISSMKHFEEMNNVYKEYFKAYPPARITVAVKELYEDLDIEVDVIAATN